MKTYPIFSLLFVALLFIHFLNTPSAIDNLAFGCKDIFDTHKDCAGEKRITFKEPQAIKVLQQKSWVQCGFHALKNGVIFLNDPSSVYNNQELYLNNDVYQDYYGQWLDYANKEGSIDESINTCIKKELPNEEAIIVVLSNVTLNNGVVSFSGPIGMTESVKLFNLLERLNSENPEDFVILLGVSKDYVQGHWRALLVDAVKKNIFVADSYVNNETGLTTDNRLLANYVKESILDKGACNYLQYYFNQYLAYMKTLETTFSLKQAFESINKDFFKKFKDSSPASYAQFNKEVELLKSALLQDEKMVAENYLNEIFDNNVPQNLTIEEINEQIKKFKDQIREKFKDFEEFKKNLSSKGFSGEAYSNAINVKYGEKRYYDYIQNNGELTDRYENSLKPYLMEYRKMTKEQVDSIKF